MAKPDYSAENASSIIVQGYECSPGDTIRIVVKHDSHWRPMFWLHVKRDGSVYLGPRLTKVEEMIRGTSKLEDGKHTVRYDEGQQVTDREIIETKGKISFHASGVIHSAGERAFRDSFRDLKEQQELCRVLFIHPKNFIQIEKIEAKDICLDYPVDDKHPIQALVFVAPLSKARIVHVQDAVYQINCYLVYRGLQGTPDLLFQVVLFNGPEQPWPGYTTVVFQRNAGLRLEDSN